MNKELVKYESKNQIEEAGHGFKEQVNNLKITSRETYGQMVELVRMGKVGCEAVKAFYESMRKKTYDAYQEVVGQIRQYSTPFTDGEKIGKQRMRGWEEIEAKRQREAEQKAREKAAVEQRKAEEAAQEAAEKGEPAPPPPPPAPVIPVENKAHVAGVTYVDNWKGRVTDITELLKAVLAGTVNPDFVMVNESEINKFAKATSGKMPVPGIEWYNDKTVRMGK